MFPRLCSMGPDEAPVPSIEQVNHEANFSTKPAQTCPHPRFPCPQRHSQRPKGSCRTSREGARSPDPLNGTASLGASLNSQGSPRAAFPQSLRLRDQKAFRRVFEAPKRFPGAGLTVLARSGLSSFPRLGLAISKRCASRAVDRNRIKRIIRESFRLRASDLPKVDIVVLCGKDARFLPPDDLRHTLDAAWDRIRSLTWDDS